MPKGQGSGKRRRGNGPDPELDAAEHEILFPFREVTLFGPGGEPGETVVVRGWDIDTWATAIPHLEALTEKIGLQLRKSPTIQDITRVARPELERLICITLGWKRAEFRQKVHTAEEFLNLADAVWVTSIMRPGGGALPLLIRLNEIFTELVTMAVGRGLVELPSQRPSTDSSELDTPSPTSGG